MATPVKSTIGRDLGLLIGIPAVLVVVLFVTCFPDLSSISTAGLTAVQQGVITKFDEPMVNVRMHESGAMTVILVNSPHRGGDSTESRSRALAIARYAVSQWQGTPAVSSVSIGFLTTNGVGGLSLSRTETPYTFRLAELRTDQDAPDLPLFGISAQRKARVGAALERIRNDTLLWRQLSTGPRRSLTEAPLLLRTSHYDFQDGKLGDSIPGSIASRFGGFYMDSAYLARGETLFLVSRVELPSSVGIVLRTPGMYDPSALQLWVVRPEPFEVSGPIPLADVWGDAGESTQDQASLRLVDGAPVLTLTVCTTYRSIEAEGEDSTASDTVEVVRDSAYVGRWNGDSFSVALQAAPATATFLEGTGLSPCARD